MNTRGWLLAAVVLTGCPEEKVGSAEPVPIAQPIPRPPAPKPPPPVEAPPPKAEAPKPPPAPTGPAGLTRSKVGDSVEFTWKRLGDSELSAMDQGAAMAAITGSGGKPDLEKLKQMAAGVKPKASVKTGTVVVTRTEPETPFTFRVDIKTGRDSEAKFYAYGADIPLHEVLFHTDDTDPRRKMKVAGVDAQVVDKESRVLAPGIDALALAGGLVSDTSPEETPGAVSVALVKYGPSKSVAAPTEPVKKLDTFEAPITVAMRAITKFGVVDPEEKLARDAALQDDIARVAKPCMKDAKPATGVLQGSIAGKKVESLMWAGGVPPKAFEKCLRAQLGKLKLPNEETFLNVPLPRSE